MVLTVIATNSNRHSLKAHIKRCVLFFLLVFYSGLKPDSMDFDV